ncbi:MAG: hypothetical protein IJ769_00315 [Clostridia bacterium]|nr:hypothetical protein [Clostridia bacterium]
MTAFADAKRESNDLSGTDGVRGDVHVFLTAGCNSRQQLRQIVTLPFFALLTAWVCTLLSA